MNKIFAAILAFFVFSCGQAFSKDAPLEKGRSGDKTPSSEIILTGKVFCSLNRNVIIPFHCIITSLNAVSGQRVKEGQVLSRYRLEPDAALKLRQGLSSFVIEDLEMRLAEINASMAKLEDKKYEISTLSDHDMAPTNSLDQINREIGLLNKKKTLIQGRLPVERTLLDERKAVAIERLGASIGQGSSPIEGVLKSPVGCHVIWVHPELKEGSEFGENSRVITVGVMDPVVIRAQVHEIEAIKLAVGDEASFYSSSIPDREFKAKVSRISWASLTPQVNNPSYYELEFEVANPDYVLREGLRGRIVIRKNNK